MISDMTIKIIIIPKGSAAISDAVWSASRPPPPLTNSTLAVPAINAPQINLTISGGLRLPREVIDPSTKVAESADVMKNMKMNISDSELVTIPSSNSNKMENNANSSFLFTISEIPPAQINSTSKAVVPKLVNQISASTDGAINTPVTNSRMVRPLEIRAINRPTNGAQEICQAQKKIVLAPNQPLSSRGVSVKLIFTKLVI